MTIRRSSIVYFTRRPAIAKDRLGSTPVIENSEPNFRKGSGSGYSNRDHYLACLDEP